MISAGYMYKNIESIPDWLKVENVADIYSVSNCISNDFCDYINYWKHNGFWLFDSLELINTIASENGISLRGMTPFYYRIHPLQWVGPESKWEKFESEASFSTKVVEPVGTNLEGFDFVSYSAQTSAECSPLSCNGLAQTISVNNHCLLDTFEIAKSTLESGDAVIGEPGPYRIFEVHTL